MIMAVLFMPGTAGATHFDYKILVNFRDFTLSLLRPDHQLVARYLVALPKFMPKNLPIKGEVTRIECPAVWYPTAKTRHDYLAQRKIDLPSRLDPGDPRNALGAAKIIIAFYTPGVDSTCRIHGTNDPSSIGQRVSRWCIRMHNQDILQVKDLIIDKKTQVIFVKS